MIDKAIAILQQAGYDLTARELAEIFWLAVNIKPSSGQTPAPRKGSSKQPSELDIDPTKKTIEPSRAISPPEPTVPVVIPAPEPTAPVVRKPSRTENTEAIPIKIPAANALRNALALGRALRPLRRKVPSSTEKILDEEATVQRFAEDQIGIPILKSTPEKWLELALVIEETSITEIWEETIREFQQLLKYHGAFRDVRTWKLTVLESNNQTSYPTEIQLFPQHSTGFDESIPQKPDVLIHPQGRRLILLISDCISPIWRKQLIHPTLELWGQRVAITILQLLPERFWDRTALVDEVPVLLSHFSSRVTELYNSQLIFKLWDEDDRDEFAEDEKKRKKLNSSISIPIITLEPEPLLRWSKVIAGQGNISTAGFKFYSFYSHQEINIVEKNFPTISPSSDSTDLEQEVLVNLFRSNASLQARRLGGLMASLPVSISVVNLIQQTLLPESTQIHVAEVFMSGLLKRLPVSQPDETEYITYDFVDGVRELLRDFVPPNKQLSVIDQVTKSIVKRLGLSVKEFDAELLTYNRDDKVLQAKIRPFAQLKIQVLRQLGGDYALVAKKLEFSQFSQEYAGEYTCTVKSGGKTGTWRKESEPEKLFISPQGKVEFRSRFGLAVIQNLKLEEQTLSWNKDDNGTSASITFKENSEDSYFWEIPQTGKLFEGWLQYPDEGRIDFRGKLVRVLKTFEFEAEVATIVFEPVGKNYGISIGVNQYQYLQTLESAVRDAQVMKHWFDEQNFSSLEPSPVDFRLDPISATVEEFLQRKFEEPFLSEEDNVWFFFSGHSRFQDGVDYLMLADSMNERVAETGVSLNFLVKQLLRSGAGKVILFLDMDRLPAPGSSSVPSSFVAEGKKDDQGVIIFYACEPNTAAYEPKQLQYGSFTYALVEALLATQGNLSINQLAKFLRDRVPELNEQNTQASQTPQSLILPTSNGEWVPFPSNFQVFNCQTPKVNRRGETIHRDTKLIRYFTETLTDNITLEMVAIPSGTFTMGSPENEKDSHDDERPQHNVTLSLFFMGKYPITQAQWKAIATRTDLKENIDLEEDPSRFKDPYQKDQETIERWLRPVENVNWYEAVEFCQRLSKLTGRDYQLPSEAQWEYACRAVTEPLDLENGESYPPFYFGETITGELANYDASNTYADEPSGEESQETTPVGQFPSNAFGLYDMHGNVWEWCLDDWHSNYEDAPDDGSAWMKSETSYLAKNRQKHLKSVLRGGSWFYTPYICRSAIRNSLDSREYRSLNLGFRVVCVFGGTQ